MINRLVTWIKFEITERNLFQGEEITFASLSKRVLRILYILCVRKTKLFKLTKRLFNYTDTCCPSYYAYKRNLQLARYCRLHGLNFCFSVRILRVAYIRGQSLRMTVLLLKPKDPRQDFGKN